MNENNLNKQDFKSPHDLKLGDIKSLLNLLNEFIEQSYKAEKEFKDFKILIELILEMIPQAVVVFNDSGSLFYKNQKASELEGLLELDFDKEIEFEAKLHSNIYLVQIANISHKKIVTATNITEQKRQERLANMGQVSAHLAHEIRNPIGSISLLTSVLSKRVDSESLEIVEEIKKSIWRIERIIKSTLLFSKGVQVNMQECNIVEVEKSINQVISEYTYTKNINFHINLEVEKLYIDFALFEIVLHNLLCNAIDAIEEGECEEGECSIFLKRVDNFHIFRISDNGKRIEDANSLFEAFKTTKLKGHGLGLALSQQIILAHGGILNANDDGIKYFEIKLPIN